MNNPTTTTKLLLFSIAFFLGRTVLTTSYSNHDLMRSHSKEITIVKTSNATERSNAYAVVTLANQNYERCAMKLMRDLREAGRWRADIVMMVSYEVDAEAVAWLTANKISILHIKNESRAPYYLKWHIFKHPFFRQYKKIMYLDSDTTVALPIEPLFSLQFPVDVWILMRDNGPGIGKGDLHNNELAVKLPIPNKKNPGGANAILVDMSRIPDPKFVDSIVETLLTLLEPKIKFHDQSVLHFLFLEHFAVFAPCNPIKIVLANQVVDKLWFKQHCQGKEEIFVHDYQKKCMASPHNLFTEIHKSWKFKPR
jgi:hypothetical protein